MSKTNLDEQKKLTDEIHEHSQKGIDLLKEGQAIHRAYQNAPEKRSLTEEVDAFIEKDRQGTAELRKANELQKDLLEKQRAGIEKQRQDLQEVETPIISTDKE